MLRIECDICRSVHESKNIAIPDGWNYLNPINWEGAICPECIERQQQIIKEERERCEQRIDERLRNEVTPSGD